MPDRRTDIIASLESGLNRTVDLFNSFDSQDLETTVYQDGAEWTVKQVLAHLVTIEQSMHWLFRNILSGGPGSPKDFDVERFNQKQPRRYAGYSIDELLLEFSNVRKETIEIVQDMSEDDLDRQGWHAFHGNGPLSRFICWAYEHARLHEDDIGAVLDAKDT